MTRWTRRTRRFTLTLSSATNATLDDSTATGTIIDDDSPGSSEVLTAQFIGMPESHGGAGSSFIFELQLSEEIEISFETLRDSAFQVTGGAVTGARRLAQGSNQRWEVTVQPASHADVVLALPATTDCNATSAICTSDDRPLSNSLSATVAGPALSISDATATEGDAVEFTVSLSAASSQQVDGPVRHLGRHGGEWDGLHGGDGDADVRGGRDVEDGERVDNG